MKTLIWLIIIVIFVGIEMATVGLTSIWFAGGALIAFIAHLAGASVFWQIMIFIASSAIFLTLIRPWALKYFKPRLVKTNYETVLGEKVRVTVEVDNIKGTGTAIYKGQEWTARAAKEDEIFEAGAIVTVKEIRGVTLYVER